MAGLAAALDVDLRENLGDLTGAVIYKMTGSGNDFVFADARSLAAGFWTADRIREICARQTGVGAAQLSLLMH